MMRTLARTSAFIYAGLFTAFALLSGADSAEGVNGLFLNLPNVLPWLLVWGALLAAWKNPGAGGALFLVLAGAFTLFFHTYQGLFSFLLISMPLILIGILFLADLRREWSR
jgi:hypothetical protein